MNDVIQSNILVVRQVASGALASKFITKRYGYRTGTEAYRDTPYSEPRLRPTFGVGVEIVHDAKRKSGFYVKTAYPRNEDPMDKKLRASPAFRLFCSFMIQDYESFASMDDIIRFGLSNATYHNPSLPRELEAYLKTILVPSISDAQRSHLWNSTGAEFSGNDRFIREFLLRTLAILEKEGPDNAFMRKPIKHKEG